MARQWAMRDDPACNSSQRMTSRVRTDICWVLSLGMLINKSTYTRQPDLIRVGYIVSEVADVLEILAQGFRRWLCRNCFSQHDVGFSLQRVVRIEDQVDLPRTPLLDHHRMLQEVTTHRGEVHRLVTLW